MKIDGKEVDPNVWDVLFQRATKEKAWAENHEYAQDPDAWPASSVSIDMLKKRLSKTAHEIAVSLYRYLDYRAHLKDRFGYPIAPDTAKDWEEWSKGDGKDK